MKLKNRLLKLVAYAYLMLALISLSYCNKIIEVDPPITSTTGDAVFNNDATAISALTGIYSSFSSTELSNSVLGLPTITKRSGLSADELTLWSGAGISDIAYYRNALNATKETSIGHELWITIYPLIAGCNAAIEGLQTSKMLSPSIKQQLHGEAFFLRAFLYFYLVNLYGDVPLILTTDYQVNRLTAKTPKTEVYQQIVRDLKSAFELLNSDYWDGTLMKTSVERVRPNKWVASALLSRVYLYLGEWSKAEEYADKIISNVGLFNLSDLNKVFLRAGLGNHEAIWQLQPVNMSGALFLNTEDARFFVLSASPIGLNFSHKVYLSSHLLSSFEQNDNRKIFWIDSFVNSSGTYLFPYKYKIATGSSTISEYLMVFRLAEQYLIRSEARAQQNKISDALSDINTIRNRAGLKDTTINEKSSLLTAILHERQVELFCEWGHRWLDLKRTGTIDVVMNKVTPVKANGAIWKSYQQWYPIPLQDIQRDPNLIQNTGY